MMTPTAARPALKATFGSLTGSAKNKKAEKEKENVVPSPPLLKNIVASSTNNDAAKKSSNTANTKAVSGGAKRKTAAAEKTPKTPAVDAVATKKVRKNAASNAEKVAAATKKEEEKIEKEKEIPRDGNSDQEEVNDRGFERQERWCRGHGRAEDGAAEAHTKERANNPRRFRTRTGERRRVE